MVAQHVEALRETILERVENAHVSHKAAIDAYARSLGAVLAAGAAIDAGDLKHAARMLDLVPGNLRDAHWHALRRAALAGEREDETPTLPPPAI
jgi:hypothetical protein